MKHKQSVIQDGFTIVELLIVIVVIGILAAISVVAYSGIQNNANDASVKSDLSSIAKKFEMYKVQNGVYPVGVSQIGSTGIKVNKSAYGNGVIGNTYNILYCRLAAEGPNEFALIASSKSGQVFTFKSSTGALTVASGWAHPSNSTTNCQNAGINQTIGSDRDWLFLGGSWASYL